MSDRTLTFEERDRIDTLLAQVDGVLICIGVASGDKNIADHAIPNACWAGQALLDQLREIIFSKQTPEAAP